MSKEPTSKLPDSAIPLLRFLEDNGQKTQREIIKALNLPTRTVRYAIRRLLERELIRKQPNLFDMRSVFYTISDDVMDIESIIAEEMKFIKV